VSQVLGQVPRQCVVFANDAVARTRKNQIQGHGLDGDRRFDGTVTLVVQHLEVFKLVVKDGGWLAFDIQCGIGKRFTAELQRHLLVVVAVNVAVTARPDEVAHVQVALLRHHVGQQGVAGNVEGHAQKNIGTALVQLAAQFGFFARALCRRHIELEERVARHERHLVKLGHVPRADDDAAAVGVAFEGINDLLYLVNVSAIWGGPAAPLHAVNGAKVAVFAGPFIPNRYVAFFEPVVVARPRQEPQQLLNDGAQVNLLGGDQRKPIVQIEAHLMAKHALGARAGAVGFSNTVIGHVLHEIFILAANGAHKGK
jgi:hypothetical protein